MEDKVKEYDQESVFCCKDCLSLRIRMVEDQDYCDSCGSTDIKECSIDDWAAEYSRVNGEDKVIRHKSIFKAED